jgi:hypothetical protein
MTTLPEALACLETVDLVLGVCHLGSLWPDEVIEIEAWLRDPAEVWKYREWEGYACRANLVMLMNGTRLTFQLNDEQRIEFANRLRAALEENERELASYEAEEFAATPDTEWITSGF